MSLFISFKEICMQNFCRCSKYLLIIILYIIVLEFMSMHEDRAFVFSIKAINDLIPVVAFIHGRLYFVLVIWTSTMNGHGKQII